MSLQQNKPIMSKNIGKMLPITPQEASEIAGNLCKFTPDPNVSESTVSYPAIVQTVRGPYVSVSVTGAWMQNPNFEPAEKNIEKMKALLQRYVDTEIPLFGVKDVAPIAIIMPNANIYKWQFYIIKKATAERTSHRQSAPESKSAQTQTEDRDPSNADDMLLQAITTIWSAFKRGVPQSNNEQQH